MPDKLKCVEKALFLLPPAADKCQECAITHPPEHPHNAQSLFYQMKFQLTNGRGASWIDAMAHCTPEMQAFWTKELTTAGVDVAGGKVHPEKGHAPQG